MAKFDVVVVGAGPGGSMAAKTAAEKGLKTVFFERGKEPGIKNSSGCGLGSRWWRDFPEVFEGLFKLPSARLVKGAQINVLDDNRKLVTRVTTAITDADEAVHTYKGKNVGLDWCNVYRKDLDLYLAGLACEAGAELRKSVLVNDVIMENGVVCGVKTETGEAIHADIVIAADGAYSTMAVKSGMRGRWRKEDITLVPQMDFSCPESRLDDVIGPWHYLWFAPMGSFYQVNFRDGFHIGTGQWFNMFEKKPTEYFKMALATPDFQRMCRALDAKPREFQSHMLPWMQHPPKTYTAGMLLVGDAGGFPCPLEAEGVWHACYSGRIAAGVAADAISKGDTSEEFLSDYERRWENSHLGREYDFGKEYADLWRYTAFNHANMKVIANLVAELQWFNAFNIVFDWSDGHMEALNKHLEHIFELLPQLTEMGKLSAPLFKGLLKGITPENREKVGQLIKSMQETMK